MRIESNFKGHLIEKTPTLPICLSFKIANFKIPRILSDLQYNEQHQNPPQRQPLEGT